MTTSVWFVCIPWSVLTRKGIRPVDKLLFGLLRWLQNGLEDCSPEQGYLAQCLRVSVRTIGASVRRLEAAGLLEVRRRFKKTCVYVVKDIRDARYLRVTDAILSMPGLTALQKLMLANLGYKSRNELGIAWPHHGTLSEELGVSRSAILRALGGRKMHGRVYPGLEQKEKLQVNHRGGGRGLGNQYIVVGSSNSEERPHDRRETVAKLPTIKTTNHSKYAAPEVGGG